MSLARGPARDHLVVFDDGDERPGLIVYGLRDPTATAEPVFPQAIWPTGVRAQRWDLYGDHWRVLLWDVTLPIWPAGTAFRTAVQVTVSAMIDVSCRVAWVGAEGIPFADPPDLFDPEYMSGALLAWLLDDGAFECPLDPDLPIRSASDSQLAAVRRHARGLADAPS